MIKSLLIAGLGGFLGTCCRFLVVNLTNHCTGPTWAHSFPVGTFVVNTLGCFILGLVVGVIEKHQFISPHVSLFLITGFCGGFTTFSSMSNDMYQLLQNRNPLYFFLYFALTVVLGFVFVWAGRAIMK